MAASRDRLAYRAIELHGHIARIGWKNVSVRKRIVSAFGKDFGDLQLHEAASDINHNPTFDFDRSSRAAALKWSLPDPLVTILLGLDASRVLEMILFSHGSTAATHTEPSSRAAIPNEFLRMLVLISV